MVFRKLLFRKKKPKPAVRRNISQLKVNIEDKFPRRAISRVFTEQEVTEHGSKAGLLRGAQVAKNADEKTIKKLTGSWRRKYHPDTNAGNPDAEKKFKEVTEAYSGTE